MEKLNRVKKIIAITALICCNGAPAYTQRTIGEYLYNECDTAWKLNCGENIFRYPNPHRDGNAIVWYYFNTTTAVHSSVFFSSNTANIYYVGIFGPFNATTAREACSDTTMLDAQWPSGGIYHSFFPAAPSYTTPIITFQPGFYIFHVRYINFITEQHNAVFTVKMNCVPPKTECINCIGSFAPSSGKYILGAWVKEDINDPNVLTYLNPQIHIDFPTTSNPTGPVSSLSEGPFTAAGRIIDGWQRIETEFTIPPLSTYINLRLQCLSGNCFFDDIRIFPVDGSMKSYVYDPVNLRLVAELDERNYATLYEYDEEGKLIRVKKETEKGIMTIKENKNNTTKRQ